MIKLFQIGTRTNFHKHVLTDMHQLRARVFRERMGWDVQLLSGLEIDAYDALDPWYMLIQDGNGQLRGCWRMLPTTGPYMLKDTFPSLLHGESAPEAENVWELSRFAIETDRTDRFGFATLALDAMREIVTFGDQRGISHYVTVTTTAIERLLRFSGIVTRRFGPPIRIGVENAVALEIDIGSQTHCALFGRLDKAA